MRTVIRKRRRLSKPAFLALDFMFTPKALDLNQDLLLEEAQSFEYGLCQDKMGRLAV